MGIVIFEDLDNSSSNGILQLLTFHILARIDVLYFQINLIVAWILDVRLKEIDFSVSQ